MSAPACACAKIAAAGSRRELLQRELRVVEPPQLLRAVFDVAPRPRAVLVERRPAGRGVLLERERERRVGLRLAVEVGERAEAVAPKRLVELGRADCHVFSYFPGGASPLWQPGHQYAIRLSSPCPRLTDRRAAARAGAARTAVDGPLDAERLRGTPASAARASPRAASSSSSAVSPSRSQGESRACQSASARQMFPIPATSRWSRSASPSSRRRSAARSLASDAGEVGRLGEDVGPETADGAVRQLEDRTAAEHGLVLAAAEHEPGQAANLGAAGEDAPAPGHPQVAAEDETAFEDEQEVLAARLDAVEHAPVEPLCDGERTCPRVTRLDLDPIAHEHLEAERRTVQGVAFGHVGKNRDVSRARSAAAGAVASAVWALEEPLDMRIVDHDYSDVALLGKLVTRVPAGG